MPNAIVEFEFVCEIRNCACPRWQKVSISTALFDSTLTIVQNSFVKFNNETIFNRLYNLFIQTIRLN